MNLPFEWRVGWRYTRAGRAQRHNTFISFISAVSMAGIALGVAALIIVLSVMNGFQKEVRDRMLSVIAHIEITRADGAAMPDWPAVAAVARRHKEVVGAAPFVSAQVLIARGEDMRGMVIRGIDPAYEPQVTPVVRALPPATLRALAPGSWGLILGADLAQGLGVSAGDPVTIIAPNGDTTVAGVMPRLKRMTVLGTFKAGHYEYDNGMGLMRLEDAQRLFRLDGPGGVQLRLADAQTARHVADELQAELGMNYNVNDWTRTNINWFDAVQIEKRMMFIILTLIVAVAAFNLVSTLVMTVTDKRADIAILRTLGASPRSIMGIFFVQGAVSGVVGTLAGLGLGLLVAFHIDVIVPAIEHALGVRFLPSSVYLISRMPSDPQAGDIVPITLISLVMAFLATLYPSWRASQVQPAQALRYE
jgi:lipoprotein-releasing system permease protein